MSEDSLDICQSWSCSVRLHGAAVALLGNHQPHQFSVELLDLLHILSLVRLVLETLEESRGQPAVRLEGLVHVSVSSASRDLG